MKWRHVDQFQLASDLKTTGVGWLQVRVQNWAGNVTLCGCGGVDDAIEGSGVKVQGSGFRVQGSGFRSWGSGFRVQGAGFRVQDVMFKVQELGFRVKGLRFRS